MKVEMALAKKKLAYTWIFVTASVFVLLIFLSATGKFKDSTQELWGWFLQNTTPILTLIIGVIVVEAKSKVKSKKIERFYYRLCLTLTITFFTLLVLTLFIIPLAQKHGGFTPIGFINFSNIYLGPFQGFVTAALGIFFVKSENDES
jgi:uncharacterized membrane protein YiaA